jgi:4-hydroxythreonine-4-phosphate dehydrogenase
LKPIAITLGDPAGIGTEVVLAALGQIDPTIPIALFGDWDLASRDPSSALLQTFHRVPPGDRPEPGSGRFFHDVALSRGSTPPFGEINPLCGRIALASIHLAVDAIEGGVCSALVTAPIQKQAIAAAGSRFPGHTELLASRAGLTRYGEEYAMYFDSPSLRVVLLSVHLPLRQAIEQISSDGIAAVATLMAREYRKLHGREPTIAVAALNPHGGEGGRFGDEEAVIREGVNEAVRRGILASGPHSADTVFHSAAAGRYDVVLALYHDQGLIAVKTLAFEQSVNVTIGLPYLRCSVDHGTAYDIAGKGVADFAPMRYAIEWAAARLSREAG